MSPVTKGVRTLVAEAEAEVETVTMDEALTAVADGALFVDLRDVRELDREGRIPGAYHAPRGMLEFWVDPDSPYHREALSSANRLILFCNLGWRSALAAKALQDMGMGNVAHLEGGFEGWKAAGGEVQDATPGS
jgi:rhodanese-related sulfurtransferase